MGAEAAEGGGGTRCTESEAWPEGGSRGLGTSHGGRVRGWHRLAINPSWRRPPAGRLTAAPRRQPLAGSRGCSLPHSPQAHQSPPARQSTEGRAWAGKRSLEGSGQASAVKRGVGRQQARKPAAARARRNPAYRGLHPPAGMPRAGLQSLSSRTPCRMLYSEAPSCGWHSKGAGEGGGLGNTCAGEQRGRAGQGRRRGRAPSSGVQRRGRLARWWARMQVPFGQQPKMAAGRRHSWGGR